MTGVGEGVEVEGLRETGEVMLPTLLSFKEITRQGKQYLSIH